LRGKTLCGRSKTPRGPAEPEEGNLLWICVASLVPFDFSGYSEKALNWALAMAEQWRSHVLLLHVIPRLSYPPLLMGGYFNVGEFEAGLQADAEARAKAIVAHLVLLCQSL
jgi:hypothetical protein